MLTMIAALAYLCGALATDVYYVSPAGLDSNAGTKSAPFKTLAKANTVATSGDTGKCLVRPVSVALARSRCLDMVRFYPPP